MIDTKELRRLLEEDGKNNIDLDEIHELLDRLEAAEKERDDLRAKIEAMEKQEPVATIHINSITGNPSVDFIPGHRYLHHNSSLYALPGAQTQGEEK